MKNKIILVAIAMMAAFAVSCKKEMDSPPPPAPMADAAQIKTDIQAMETAFADNMNAGKPEAVNYYADDATSYGQNKPASAGKQAIMEQMKKELGEGPKGGKASFTTNEVFPSADGEQVAELGSYKMSDSTGTVVASGNFMALFHKKDGKYVCVRDMSASEMPHKK